MTNLKNLSTPTEANLLIAFSDLTLFARYARGKADPEIFETMAEYAEFVGETIEGAGGTVVKFIGDAVLIVFPEESVGKGVLALLALKKDGDKWMASRGLPCRHRIKAHLGPVTCGPFGTKTEKRFDLYGGAVNTAATLASHGLTITPQVFRKLGPEIRKHFKKHTPPITYIPVEESHRG